MENKRAEKYLTSLIIRKLQIKSPMVYYYTITRMAKLQLRKTNIGKDVVQIEFS